jgi:hypothetical protein
MIITLHTENRTYIIEDVDEITIESKKSLIGTQIPEEEGTQGFRWVEDD